MGSSGGNKQGQHLQCIGVFLCVAGRCKLPVRKGCEKLMFFYFIFSEALRLTCTSPVRYVASHSIRAFTVSPSYYSRALNVAFVSWCIRGYGNFADVLALYSRKNKTLI